jgi:hypothetical protein
MGELFTRKKGLLWYILELEKNNIYQGGGPNEL